MAIPAIAIVVGALAGSGGLVFGALIRQPQINKLKAQVVKLQEELDTMHLLVDDVIKDIQILKLNMQVQQNEDLLSELKGQGDTSIGKLVYAYGLKEYLEVKQKFLILKEDITEEQALFADAFSMFLDNRIPDDENGLIQKQFIRGYLLEKYGCQIDNLEVPDLKELLETLKQKCEEVQSAGAGAKKDETKQTLIPELECLSLNEEQTRFLYSLELLKIEYDIRTAKSEAEKKGKITWKNEWIKCILRGLGKESRSASYFIRDAESLYRQMRDAYDKSVAKTWYYLIAFEAVLFKPYFPLLADKKANRLWNNLKLSKDYIMEEFCNHQKVVDKAMLEKMVREFNKYISKLSGKTLKTVAAILLTTAVSVATGGLASYFAPGIAVMIAGGGVVHLSGQALINASLAFVGGGSLAAGGLGMAGGAAVITGGGALLGMFGGGASTVAAMVLLSTQGYVLRECAKLITFSSTVLIDEFLMRNTVSLIQKTIEKRIEEFGGQLAVMKATPKADKNAIKAITKNLDYLGKCNQSLLALIGA